MYRVAALAAWIATSLLVQAGLELPSTAPGGSAKPAIAVPAPVNDGTAAKPADPFGDTLLFKNGDRLHGKLVAVDGVSSLTWQRQDVPAPIAFGADLLYAVKLARTEAENRALELTRVQLTNDDVLFGRILGLDEHSLRLETPYGGELTIHRYMVGSIQPMNEQRQKLIYEGPNDLAEWNTAGGQWQIDRGVLTGFGRIGADLQLPERARFRFELRFPARFTNFSIAMFCNDINNFYQDAYHLNFGGNNVTLHRRSQTQGTLNLGQVEVPQLMASRRLRVEVLVNREESKFALLLNDELVKEWTDPQGFAGKGTSVVFNSHDRSAPLGLARLTVSTWDGKLANLGALQASDHDVVQLANFDRITGDVLTIRDEQLVFKTPYAEMTIPLARVTTVALAKDRAQRARRYDGDVELYFPEGEKFTLRLAELTNNRLTGYSENTGEVTVDLAVFNALRFNVYDDDLPSAEDEEVMTSSGAFNEMEGWQGIQFRR